MCDRVGIMDSGVLKAEGTRRELVSMVGERDRMRFTVASDARGAAAAVSTLGGVEEVSHGAGVVELMVEDARSVLPDALRAITDAGLAVTAVEVTEPDLEAVFLHLTGRALRD